VRGLSILLAVTCACSSRGETPAMHASSPKLPPPAVVDSSVRGAPYLAQVGDKLQTNWAQFLEDCRLRLPASHPLNQMTLAATADLAVDRAGKIVEHQVASSGNPDFDRAVKEVIADASPLPAPPLDLRSDDDLVHLRWLFARDRRQAGPATAQVTDVQLALAAVVARQVRGGDLVRAARRITTAPATDPEREAATERVMTAALREALGSADVAVRRTAVEAIGRAKVLALAEDVRGLLGVTTDLGLRLAAIDTAAELADREAAVAMLAQFPIDLAEHDRLALAETRALVKLDHTDDATKAIRTLLDADGANPHPIAVRALAHDPVPALAAKLAKWFERGDARTRAAVCGALSGGGPAWSQILRGMRDGDATVRATCADSAGKQARAGAKPPGDVLATLRDLARDRDAAVRAKAITAAFAVAPQSPIRATVDPAPEVRIAAAGVASLADLKVLVEDKDPDVRAAAVTACAAIPQAKELAVKHAADPASQVRRAAVASLEDGPELGKLVGDDAPEVATVALVRLAALRGRAAMTTPLLVRVAGWAPRSAERMRSALAWLLAR
jgi:hypothetical protein